jgi:hypothetical protein
MTCAGRAGEATRARKRALQRVSQVSLCVSRAYGGQKRFKNTSFELGNGRGSLGTSGYPLRSWQMISLQLLIAL